MCGRDLDLHEDGIEAWVVVEHIFLLEASLGLDCLPAVILSQRPHQGLNPQIDGPFHFPIVHLGCRFLPAHLRLSDLSLAGLCSPQLFLHNLRLDTDLGLRHEADQDLSQALHIQLFN